MKLTEVTSPEEQHWRSFIMKLNDYAPGPFKMSQRDFFIAQDPDDEHVRLIIDRRGRRDLRYAVRAVYNKETKKRIKDLGIWARVGKKSPPFDKGMFADYKLDTKEFGNASTEYTLSFNYYPPSELLAK